MKFNMTCISIVLYSYSQLSDSDENDVYSYSIYFSPYQLSSLRWNLVEMIAESLLHNIDNTPHIIIKLWNVLLTHTGMLEFYY